jgi:hypothetical protein
VAQEQAACLRHRGKEKTEVGPTEQNSLLENLFRKFTYLFYNLFHFESSLLFSFLLHHHPIPIRILSLSVFISAKIKIKLIFQEKKKRR